MAKNFIDRCFEAVAPVHAVRRSAARTALQFLNSGYGNYGANLTKKSMRGWEYHGEKAWEYLFGTHKYNMIYRVVFSLVVYVGATQTLDLVWNLSDIANALMAIPNLLCLLVLNNDIAHECFEYQELVVEKEKAGEEVDLSHLTPSV